MGICKTCFRPGLLLLLLLQSLTVTFTVGAQDDSLLSQIQALDDSYQQLLQRYYRDYAASSEPIDDIEILQARFNTTIAIQNYLPAFGLMAANLDTLVAQSKPKALSELIELLLRHNQIGLVTRFLDAFEQAGDNTGVAIVEYNLARYYARLKQWDKAYEMVNDTFSELPSEDSDYAYLLQGSALQNLKQHRESTSSYANIPGSSGYYVHAQLNTAIANIRQGWITDARLIISKIVPISKNSDPELTNRIYLVLGYALLNKEYYRDARDAFRKISLDSQYINKALLGIALTAISQGDYVGAYNALNILKAQQLQDFSSDESYLLLPYVYQRLNQTNNIEASFFDSIDHFQQRLLQMNQLKNNLPALDQIRLEQDKGDLVLGQQQLPFTRYYPFYLLNNRHHLSYLASLNGSAEFKLDASRLLEDYDVLLVQVIDDVIEQHKKFYTSYLNQSRYGLARHYDDSQQTKEQ